MLLRSFLEILRDWQAAFPRQRSYRRAVAQALGTLTALGRRTLSRAIWAQGHEQQDWSADYKLHARAHFIEDHRECTRCLIQTPHRREVTTIFIRIGIAHHDFLIATRLGSGIHFRQRKPCAHDIGCIL